MGGADDRNRTGDLVITSDPLCRLSYVGFCSSATVTSYGNAWANRTKLVARPRFELGTHGFSVRCSTG